MSREQQKGNKETPKPKKDKMARKAEVTFGSQIKQAGAPPAVKIRK